MAKERTQIDNPARVTWSRIAFFSQMLFSLRDFADHA
jgi:hypothetical protein